MFRIAFEYQYGGWAGFEQNQGTGRRLAYVTRR